MLGKECIACDVISGKIVPPGGIILDDGVWVLSHSISPVLLRGWLILKPGATSSTWQSSPSLRRPRLDP